VKQIPNFLLASPVLLLSFSGTFSYLYIHLLPLLTPSTFSFFRLFSFVFASNISETEGKGKDEEENEEKEEEEEGSDENEVKGKGSFATISSSLKDNHSNSIELSSGKYLLIWKHPGVIVFVVHWLFLALTGLFVMHVQVSTRFLFSQSPALYWFVGSLYVYKGTPELLRRFLSVYFSVFIVTGAALFTNFLPWT